MPQDPVIISLVTQHADSAFAPLALLYLKAHLAAHAGYDARDIRIVEFDPDEDVGRMADALVAERPEIIGLSCYVWNVTRLMTLCDRMKERMPDVRLVAGGPEVGPVARSVLESHPVLDVIVRGEGEVPFTELVVAWTNGRSIDEIAGVSFRRGAAVVETPDAPIVRDLNQLPSPHLTLPLDLTRRIVCLETQRGCVFRCNFCFYNKDLSIRNRRFDLDRVEAELGHWLQHDVHEIYLMDPIFNLHAERAKAICRFIARHNTRPVPIHAEIWAEFVDDELADLMRAAHFRFLEVGLQSTDEGALATVERRFRLHRFLGGVECLKRHELPWELQLIFGLPGETRSSFRRALNFAASLDPQVLAVYPLMVLPGTELWRKAGDFGLTFDPAPPYHVRSHFSMSPADVEAGVRVIEALQDLGDSRTLRLLARERGLTYADVLEAWIEWDGNRGGNESLGYRVKQFIVDFCTHRAIPMDFYRGFASWEFAG